MIAERIPREERQVGEYAVRYCGRGRGWAVVQWARSLSDPHGPPEWLVVAMPFTSREGAVAEAKELRERAATPIGGPGWSVRA
jgi:hypothetical protein